MQVDSNIVINPDISLEEQDIDPQTWQLLQKIALLFDGVFPFLNLFLLNSYVLPHHILQLHIPILRKMCIRDRI